MSERVRCGIAVTVLVAAACATGTAPAASTPTPYAPSAGRSAVSSSPSAAVRYGPSAMRYVVRRTLHIQETQGEQVRVRDLGTRTYLSVAVTGPSDSLGYPTIITVDSVVGDSATPPPLKEGLDRARRLAFSGRVTPEGEFRNAVPSDSLAAQALGPLVGGFQDFLPRIPRHGVELGAVWTDTLERTQKRVGLEVTIHAIVQGRAIGWDEHAGTPSLHIETSGSYTLAGTGQSAGQPVRLGGQGSGASLAFLTADGRFVGSEGRDSAELTYRFLNEGVALGVTQVTRTTVTVLP